MKLQWTRPESDRYYTKCGGYVVEPVGGYYRGQRPLWEARIRGGDLHRTRLFVGSLREAKAACQRYADNRPAHP